MKIIKRIAIGLAVVVLGLLAVVAVKFGTDGNDKYDVSIDESKIPTFKPVTLDFTNKFNEVKSLPFFGSGLIDIDNDGVDELFLGGGYEQQDELFRFKDGGFVSISKEVNLPSKENATTLGVASTDFDNNGYTDLIVSRETGVFIYYNEAGKFTEKQVGFDLASNATPLGLTLGDVNRDGFVDIFVANYMRIDQMEGQNNFSKDYGPVSVLLMNNGDNTFTDATDKAGLTYTHNTFQGVFVDIDNDNWLDLVVAHDTGEIRTYKNNGDGTFTVKSNPTTGKYGYPMGVAVGDYNNDGLVDFMFSNTGSTVPTFIASGNIEDKSLFNSKWLFFENKGNFEFEDVAEKTKTADYEFSWGTVFADMNNDGLQDLIVAENYIAFPPHKMFPLSSRFMMQKEDNTFVPTEEASGVGMKHFPITPLVSDFNQDGYLDMVWANIGSPSMAYLNNGGDNKFLRVRLADNAKSLGAKVEVTLTSGTKLTEDFIVGEGLSSDLSSIITFGLGKETAVKVLVKYPDGSVFEVPSSPDADPTQLIDIPVLEKAVEEAKQAQAIAEEKNADVGEETTESVEEDVAEDMASH